MQASALSQHSQARAQEPSNPTVVPCKQGASLAIWTTTPWTIPANLAVAVNGDLKYAVVAAQVRFQRMRSVCLRVCRERRAASGGECAACDSLSQAHKPDARMQGEGAAAWADASKKIIVAADLVEKLQVGSHL